MKNIKVIPIFRLVRILLAIIGLVLFANGETYAQESYNLRILHVTDVTGSDYVPCATAVGEPIVNVEQHVINDVATGEMGNIWAKRKYMRKIIIYPTEIANNYCAYLVSVGKFKALKDKISPGAEGTLDGNESGEFIFVQEASISSSYFTDQLYPTGGYIGEFDYNCSVDTAQCDGYQDWVSMYFPTYFSWSRLINFKFASKDGQFWSHVDGNFQGDIL